MLRGPRRSPRRSARRRRESARPGRDGLYEHGRGWAWAREWCGCSSWATLPHRRRRGRSAGRRSLRKGDLYGDRRHPYPSGTVRHVRYHELEAMKPNESRPKLRPSCLGLRLSHTRLVICPSTTTVVGPTTGWSSPLTSSGRTAMCRPVCHWQHRQALCCQWSRRSRASIAGTTAAAPGR